MWVTSTLSYDGNWARDLPDGEGSITYSNGVIYIGTWKHGKVRYFRNIFSRYSEIFRVLKIRNKDTANTKRTRSSTKAIGHTIEWKGKEFSSANVFLLSKMEFKMICLTLIVTKENGRPIRFFFSVRFSDLSFFRVEISETRRRSIDDSECGRRLSDYV